MRSSRLYISMYKRYVDDVDAVLKLDEDSSTDEDARVAIEELIEMANEIMRRIQMKEDAHFNYHDGKIPILDMKVWVDEKNRVRHEFYQKEVSTKVVMSARTAFKSSTKKAILYQRW